MGMLTRYQKSGGFMQLLKLIETCEPQKQKKFLAMIENEDILWAKAIKTKMLSVQRILTWDDLVLGEVAIQLPEKIIAVLLHHFEESVRERFFKTLSESQKRKINAAFDEISPSAGEVNSALITFVEKVRALIIEGYIHVDRFDGTLVIESEIEEHLADGSFDVSSITIDNFSDDGMNPVSELNDGGKAESAPSSGNEEVLKLKQKIYALSKENQELKQENQTLSAKLQKIRQIA